MFMADALLVVAMAHSMNREKRTNRMNNDTISRKAAIDALDGELIITGRENAKTIRDYVNGVNKKLRELPSAERRCSWVGIDDEPCEVWECDRCGHIVERECPPRFCEECGARMDGGNE